MPRVEGGYVNPYYQEVDDRVVRELNARGRIYGARIRSDRNGAQSYPRALSWAYRKVAYIIITPIDIPRAPKLGAAFSKLMSDRKGNLTLYDSTRNQPKYPLLQSLEISNEGTIGSLLKGKFTFVVYPDLYDTGFRMEDLEESYFKPGNEVKIEWGWSETAENSESNKGTMLGIIYNFDWQVNTDLSITANCSIVSKATIAMGLSGEQTNPEQSNPPEKDPLGKPIPDSDLAGLIEKDVAALGKSGRSSSVSLGATKFIPRSETESGKKFGDFGLAYYVIGIPKSAQDDAKEGQSSKPPIVEPVYYIPLKAVCELMNGILRKSADVNSTPIFNIVCDGNATEHLSYVVSCTPDKVFFPDNTMGNYGSFVPFPQNPSVLRQDETGAIFQDRDGRPLVNIGNILLSTNLLIEVYRKFVEENQTNIAYKNITSFFNELISKINYASGEAYQLTARLIEPEMLTDPKSSSTQKQNMVVTDKTPAILSIEDSNLSTSVVESVTPFYFKSSIAKPLIKNISISSKPPGPMATAAYAEARGNKAGSGGKGSGPAQSDVRTANDKSIDTDKFDKEYEDAKKAFEDLKFSFQRTGASDKYATDLKGAFAKMKRAARGGGAGTGHWLNRALYPIDLSLTIDGINGFKFGDVIKTNLIPETYNREDTDMVFVVTKITHTISNGVWETKLDTKSRINMGHGIKTPSPKE